MRAAPLLLLLAATACAAGRRLPLAAPSDGCSTLALGYNVLLRTGESAGTDKGIVLGGLTDSEGQPIMGSDGKEAASTSPDFTSLHPAPDGSMWAVAQFESPQPAAVYLIGLDQDKATGKLTPKSLAPVSFAKWGGVWNLCAGSVSPWNTHLGGEEYEPDARAILEATSIDGDEDTSLKNLDEDAAGNVPEFLRFFGDGYNASTPMDTVRELFNPYQYGYMIEVVPPRSASGAPEARKLYTLGRNSKELVALMPDNKTAYITDDGTNVAFFKYVADKAGDLTAGTLYGAKATQTDATDGGAFDLTWIELGKLTQDEVAALIEKKTKFSDIFETAEPENGTCPDGFKSINAYVRLQECLKLQPGMEKAAAALETRRYLALLGGTTEFSKWEGLTFSPTRKEIYTSISEVRYGMEDSKSKGKEEAKYDEGGPNDVRLDWNRCGCVYKISVDEAYSATRMEALLCGTPNPDESDKKNTCTTDNIANPDNLSVVDDHGLLFIGEDASDQHENDYLWAYDLNTGNLTRILTSVYGAEVTSTYYYPSLNGHAYLVGNVQHPYLESDEDKVSSPYSEGGAGYIGYFTMPAADIKGKQLFFQEVPVPETEEAQSTNIGAMSVEACPVA